MARRLKTIAKWINENLAEKGFMAKVEEGFCSTDRKLSGTRLRRPGKGRTGNCLKVYRAGREYPIFEHNAAETYRTNEEVERWLERLIMGLELDAMNEQRGHGVQGVGEPPGGPKGMSLLGVTGCEEPSRLYNKHEEQNENG